LTYSNCVIAVDVGTSGCKVIAIDVQGKIISSVLEEYPVITPRTGWSEQIPEDWWQAAVKGLKQTIGNLPTHEVLAVGLTGQMHSMVALDESNNVVRNAILWNDQRADKQCREITALAGGLESLLNLTNNRMINGFTAGSILWMKENEPENYERTWKVLNPKDFIRLRLSGQILTDVSDASGTGVFDVKDRTWSRELIERISIKETMFPRAVESIDPAGRISYEASQLTGIPEGTLISGGGGDAVVSTTALGPTKKGRIVISLGTSGVVAMALPTFRENPEGLLQVFCGNEPGRYHAMGVTLSAAGSYKWFRDALGDWEVYQAPYVGKSVFQILDEEAAKVPAGSDGVVFLPYLVGERAPLYDPHAKGAFLGITINHTKGHFARAVMEGVAFSLKQVCELVLKMDPMSSPREIVLAGGGASSPIWRQIFADVFNLPVITVLGSAEGASFGAALLAGITSGMWENLESTVDLIEVESETFPIKENVGICEQEYKKFVRYYDALKWSFT